MTLEKANTDLFKAKLIAETVIEGVEMRVYENRIYHLKVPRYKKLTMDFIEKGYEFIDALGGGRFHNIYEFSSFSDVEPEVREWAADKNKNFNTYTDAIVVHTLAHKIIGDFYLRINRPAKPTKLFNNLESAVKWSLEQREKQLKADAKSK